VGYSLQLVWLYPEQMSIYGDRGNIIALQRRCEWRGITLSVVSLTVGSAVDWSSVDLAFFGGGQDSGQALIADDLLNRQGNALTHAIHDGLVMLAICGGYQLLGHSFLTHTGEHIPGVGAIDVTTEASTQRMIGNCVVEVSGTLAEASPYLVGFENHSGRTRHGPEVTTLGRTLVGYGDNGQDGCAGVVSHNTFGCYLHGSLLPKNPHLADHLLTLALQRRYGPSAVLSPLDDRLEWHAHHQMASRLLANTRHHKKHAYERKDI
jgi:CobQ-like glutamine amidotransferase family enzyme